MARSFLKFSRLSFTFNLISVLLLGFVSILRAAPEDRISRAVDVRNTRSIPGNIHPSAQARFDQGAVDPGGQMHDVTILFQPSSEQQAALDRLLTDQQNPSSPQFHNWLTPEEFGNRFGVSAGDQSRWWRGSILKVSPWVRWGGGETGSLSAARPPRYRMPCILPCIDFK